MFFQVPGSSSRTVIEVQLKYHFLYILYYQTRERLFSEYVHIVIMVNQYWLVFWTSYQVVRVRTPARINFLCPWTIHYFCYSKWALLNLTAGCNPEFDWHAVQGEGGRNIPPINEPC